MEEYIKSVFKLVAMTKHIKKQEYVLDGEDMLIIHGYWKAYKLYKKATLRKFRKAVVNYSISKMIPLHCACEELCKKLERMDG